LFVLFIFRATPGLSPNICPPPQKKKHPRGGGGGGAAGGLARQDDASFIRLSNRLTVVITVG
jgi:hypothetical protein